MIKRDYKISLDHIKKVNLKIFKFRSRLSALKEQKDKINLKYIKNLNEYFLEYIDYRKISQKNFKLNLKELKQINTLIFQSKIFKEKENDFWEIIKFFKNKPDILSDILIHFFSDSIDQNFIDYIILYFYPNFSNLYCNCKQPYNLLIFIHEIVNYEFLAIKSSNNILSYLKLSEKIFSGLIKNVFMIKCHKKMFSKIRNSVDINEVYPLENFQDKSLKIKKLENFSIPNSKKSHSNKYKSIINKFQSTKKKEKKSKFKEESFTENNGSFLLKTDNLDIFNQEKTIILDSEEISKKVLEEILQIILDCIREYISIEIKFFFYLIKNILKEKNIPFHFILSIFFFQKFLITKTAENRIFYEISEIKKAEYKRLSKIIKIFLNYCSLNINEEPEKNPYTKIENELTKLPNSFHFDFDEKLNKIQKTDFSIKIPKQSLRLKKRLSTQITSQNQIKTKTNLINKDFNIIKNTKSYIHKADDKKPITLESINSQFDISKLIRINSLERRRSSLSYDISIPAIPNENYNVLSDFSTTRKDLISFNNYSTSCSFHNDSVCMSFHEISMLLEIYGKTGKYVDPLVLCLSNTLSSNKIVSDSSSFIKNENVFILFVEDLKESEEIIFNIPENSIEKIFDFGFLDYRSLDFFEDKSLHDVLKYYKNFYNFGGLVQNEEEKEFMELYYNLNFHKIFLKKNMQIDFEKPNCFERDEKKNAIVHLYKSLKNLDMKFQNKEKEINIKYNQLTGKKKEIYLIENETLNFRKLKKKLLKIEINEIFQKMIEIEKIEICLSLPEDKEFQKVDFREFLNAKLIEDCDLILNENFSLSKNSFLSKEIPEHSHFHYIKDLLIFLHKYGFSYDLVEKGDFEALLKNLINYCYKLFTKKIDIYIKKKLKREIKKIWGKKEEISEEFLYEFISERVHYYLFPSNLSDKNKGFRISCEILNFIKLKDFLKNKYADIIEKNLKSPIKELQKIQESYSFKKKLKRLKNSLKKIVQIVRLITGKIPGGEELHPILIFIILKAKPINWLSSFNFLKIMLPNKEKKGELGFLLTQLELAIRIIESIDKKFFKGGDFENNLLKNEINIGIHFMRLRKCQVFEFDCEDNSQEFFY